MVMVGGGMPNNAELANSARRQHYGLMGDIRDHTEGTRFHAVLSNGPQSQVKYTLEPDSSQAEDTLGVPIYNHHCEQIL